MTDEEYDDVVLEIADFIDSIDDDRCASGCCGVTPDEIADRIRTEMFRSHEKDGS